MLYYLNQLNEQRTIYFIGLNSVEWLIKPKVKDFTPFKHQLLDSGIVFQFFLTCENPKYFFQTLKITPVKESELITKTVSLDQPELKDTMLKDIGDSVLMGTTKVKAHFSDEKVHLKDFFTTNRTPVDLKHKFSEELEFRNLDVLKETLNVHLTCRHNSSTVDSLEEEGGNKPCSSSSFTLNTRDINLLLFKVGLLDKEKDKQFDTDPLLLSTGHVSGCSKRRLALVCQFKEEIHFVEMFFS